MNSFVYQTSAFFESAFKKALKLKYWRLVVVALSVSTALFFQRPTYSLFIQNLKTPYGQALECWLANPFQKVPVEKFFAPEDLVDGGHYYGCVSHCDKLTFIPMSVS